MSPRPRRVAILGHTGREAVLRTARRLRTSLARRGCEVRVEHALGDAIRVAGEPADALGRWCQLMISLGGDGTVLTAGRALAGHRGVLLPVNLGGLGFLTSAEESELDRALDAVFHNRWPIARRFGVEARVAHGPRGRLRAAGFAMNDAVLRSAISFGAIHLRVTALGHDLGHLVADGLITASASGSTAYSLSAGGPLVAPDVEALVVTPAAPHTIGSRSLVLSPDARVKVQVLGPGPALLVMDGQAPLQLERGDVIELRRSERAVRIAENPARPFLRALQAKLGWQGSRKRSL